MKPPISGSIAGGAPSSRNSGSIVNTPSALTAPVMRNDRSRLSVDRRWARAWSCAPIARATTEDVPAPSPIATLVTTISTGNAKPSAASSASPTRPMNHASTKACAIMVVIPTSTGRAMPTR